MKAFIVVCCNLYVLSKPVLSFSVLVITTFSKSRIVHNRQCLQKFVCVQYVRMHMYILYICMCTVCVCVCVYVCVCVSVCVRACVCVCVQFEPYSPSPTALEVAATILQVAHICRHTLCFRIHCLQRHGPRICDWLHHPQRPCSRPLTLPLRRTGEHSKHTRILCFMKSTHDNISELLQRYS